MDTPKRNGYKIYTPDFFQIEPVATFMVSKIGSVHFLPSSGLCLFSFSIWNPSICVKVLLGGWCHLFWLFCFFKPVQKNMLHLKITQLKKRKIIWIKPPFFGSNHSFSQGFPGFQKTITNYVERRHVSSTVTSRRKNDTKKPQDLDDEELGGNLTWNPPDIIDDLVPLGCVFEHVWCTCLMRFFSMSRAVGCANMYGWLGLRVLV